MAKIKYIVTPNDRDMLWILAHDDVWIMPTAGWRTHAKTWGGDVDVDEYWRGLYEFRAAHCTIYPPEKHRLRARPPMAIIMMLQKQFSIVRFYYFGERTDSFPPISKNERRR